MLQGEKPKNIPKDVEERCSLKEVITTSEVSIFFTSFF
jgi:hypothetical protein